MHRAIFTSWSYAKDILAMLVTTNSVYLANYPVDMRKSIDSLMVLIESYFGRNATDGNYYVFSNKSRDKVKILCWDKNGFALWYKRLDKSRFKLHFKAGQTMSLTAEQLQWLLSGLDLQEMQGHKPLNYDVFN
jgi:transposase